MRYPFFRGPATTLKVGGDILATKDEVYEWNTVQRRLLVQNRTGGYFKLVIERDDCETTDADAIHLANGDLFTLDGHEFTKVTIYTELNAYPSGVNKNFTIIAWGEWGNY